MFDGYHRYHGTFSTSLVSTDCIASFSVETTVSLFSFFLLLSPRLKLFVAADASRDMTMSPFAAAGTAPAGAQDYTKLFKAERDNLQFSEGLYSWVGKDVEDRVLRKYGK